MRRGFDSLYPLKYRISLLDMKTFIKVTLILILLFSSYHLVRDLLQIFNLDNKFTDVFHWSHIWCGEMCDFVTLPFDLIGIIGPLDFLLNNKIRLYGKIALVTFPFWLLAILLP